MLGSVNRLKIVVVCRAALLIAAVVVVALRERRQTVSPPKDLAGTLIGIFEGVRLSLSTTAYSTSGRCSTNLMKRGDCASAPCS